MPSSGYSAGSTISAASPNYIRSDTHFRHHHYSDRPIMVIWEEFENWVAGYEADILNILDGVHQVDNVFYIATTNYIQQIPPRIRNRPSRFADVIEIGPPSANLRKAYIEAKIHPDDKIDIKKWVKKSLRYQLL